MYGMKYIYNPYQAKFFIELGVRCVDTGVNTATGKIYWGFKYDECQEAYKLWNERKH